MHTQNWYGLTPFKDILLHGSECKVTASLKAAFFHHEEIKLTYTVCMTTQEQWQIIFLACKKILKQKFYFSHLKMECKVPTVLCI